MLNCVFYICILYLLYIFFSIFLIFRSTRFSVWDRLVMLCYFLQPRKKNKK
jgi:hypothetical protein